MAGAVVGMVNCEVVTEITVVSGQQIKKRPAARLGVCRSARVGVLHSATVVALNWW